MILESSGDQFEARKEAYIANQLRVFDQRIGINGPPTIRPDLLQYNWDIRCQRRQEAFKLQDTYTSLNGLSVSLGDVIRLDADLSFKKGQWGPKSRDILDGLLRIERRKITTESQQYPNTPSFNRLTLKQLENYFQTHPNDDDLYDYFSKHGLDYIVEKAIQVYRDDFLIPQVMWMPDIPPSYDRSDPTAVLNIISNQIESGEYPTSPPSEIHEPYSLHGERRLQLSQIGQIVWKDQVIAQLTDWGITIEDNGLTISEVIHNEVPFDVLEEGIATFGSYLTEVTNVRERSPRDCYHAANYGTFSLLRGRISNDDNLKYFSTAVKSYSLARTLADVYLKGQEHDSFMKSLQTKEAEALLRVGLTQLYDKKKASETEAYLKQALANIDSSLGYNPQDERMQRLKIWTLYHLGSFYQDVTHDAGQAQVYIEKARGSISASGPVAGSIIAERAAQRLERESGIVTLDTREGQKQITSNEHIKALSQLEASIQKAVVNHYEQIGLQYITVPEIVGVTGACENVDTLFKILNRGGVKLFITQTGQLALEQALQVHRKGVYTAIHSGRDEEEEDARHLRQFRLTEEEFGCSMVGMTREIYDEEKMFEALLNHVEGSSKAMVRAAVGEHGGGLKDLYGRDVTQLQEALDYNFLRINYRDAINLLKEKGYDINFGDDLKAEHEQAIIRYRNQLAREERGGEISDQWESMRQGLKTKTDLPVFIIRYPKAIKFFNMKVSEDDTEMVLSADLILPIAGEAAGAAVREHRGRELEERLRTSEMFRIYCERTKLLPEIAIDDFRWYLDIIYKEKTDPHAGYGIGNERIIQYILGQTDIRKCSGMRQLAEETRDWEERKAVPLPA